MTRSRPIAVLSGVALILFASAAAHAQSSYQTRSASSSGLRADARAEKAEHRACEVKICAAFRKGTPGGDIRCNLTKTWSKARLNKIMKKVRVSWPWGRAQCAADITLPRQQIRDAAVLRDAKVQFSHHTVRCIVEREEGFEKAELSLQPTVSFVDGKAVKAKLNWDLVTAPPLIKSLLWTVKATDNTFNVLQSKIVKTVNTFLTKRCDAVKSDWQTM